MMIISSGSLMLTYPEKVNGPILGISDAMSSHINMFVFCNENIGRKNAFEKYYNYIKFD